MRGKSVACLRSGVLLCLLSGCTNQASAPKPHVPQQHLAQSTATVATNPNPIAAPEETGSSGDTSGIEAENEDPAWADRYQTFAGLLGKTKAQVMKACGPPIQTSNDLGALRYYMYGFVDGPNAAPTVGKDQLIGLDFAAHKTVQNVYVHFDVGAGDEPDIWPMPTLAKAWWCVGSKKHDPDTFYVIQGEPRSVGDGSPHDTIDYSKAREYGGDTVVIYGRDEKGRAVIASGSTGLHVLVPTDRFDTDKNEWVITGFHPNPVFFWRSLLTKQIQVQKDWQLPAQAVEVKL